MSKSDHALLSPSGAYKWLNCPASPRLEAEIPEQPSPYAQEGTLAHSVCEISAKKYFKKSRPSDYSRRLNTLKKDELWSDEMLHTAETYVDHLAEKAMSFESEPYTAFEVRVDISKYVPEAFGRCDCVMFGGNTLIITDYKHGKGVPVSAKENPQLMLYALGALELYQPIFGDSIQHIAICIDQPRIDSYESWKCSREELVHWGETVVKPVAAKAFAGDGEPNSGPWCRFCRASGICQRQAEQQISAFDDFKDCKDVGLLSPDQMSVVLKAGQHLVAWFEAVKAQALNKLLEGCSIPGYKVVEGRSLRVWTNQDAALEKLQASGIDRALIYDTVPKTLSQLEKMIGKKQFGEMVGEFIMKPQGKPTLATAEDTRKEYNSAASDFKAVAQQ